MKILNKQFTINSYIFILILISISSAGSIFMIIDSSEFYASFYPNNNTSFGIYAAILNEGFLLIMAATWLPKLKTKKTKYFHPGNLFLKFLMLFLFVNTIFAATYNVTKNSISLIQEQNKKNEILKLRETQLNDIKLKRDLFIKQEQRVNTVLATQELSEIQNEIAILKESNIAVSGLWLNILILFILRFSIQTSNVTTIWLASRLYRSVIAQSDKNKYKSDNLPSTAETNNYKLSDKQNNNNPVVKSITNDLYSASQSASTNLVINVGKTDLPVLNKNNENMMLPKNEKNINSNDDIKNNNLIRVRKLLKVLEQGMSMDMISNTLDEDSIELNNIIEGKTHMINSNHINMVIEKLLAYDPRLRYIK